MSDFKDLDTKMLVQIISHRNGTRSLPFESSATEMVIQFKKYADSNPVILNDYVFVIFDDINVDDNDAKLSLYPMIKIKTFIEIVETGVITHE